MKKIIFVFLLIISMGTMHYFSTQDGGTSTSQTAVAIKVIDKVREKVTLQDEKLINIKDKVINKLKQYNKNIVVRKAAHFLMYALIGGLAMIVVYLFSKQVILSASISFIYAIFDEKSQLDVIGRSGNMTDVFIDSCGALFAIIILAILFGAGKGIKNIFKRKAY